MMRVVVDMFPPPTGSVTRDPATSAELTPLIATVVNPHLGGCLSSHQREAAERQASAGAR